MIFSSFNLSLELLKALEENNYQSATKIQERVIPLVLNGSDIIARAQTGSGKTASFVLPILEKLSKDKSKTKPKIKVLVLTPTRELTIQVATTFKELSRFSSKKPKVVTLIGGESIGEQLLQVQKGCDIVVATSGRLVDILDKKQIDLSYVEFFVLDEADKMLDLGFEQELEEVLKTLSNKRQNLLFSATYPRKMEQIASKITNNAIFVSIQEEQPTVENITQRAIRVEKESRGPLLRELIKNSGWKKILVFMANKRAADNISAKFNKYGFNTDSFHGDYLQNERNEILEDFKSKKVNILFATDIAARGLHIEDIDCVVNFDLPRSPADYIHRIGRTARAGKSGVAISFIANDDFEHFKLIQKRSNIELELEIIDGYEVKEIEIKKTKGSAPIKGKRKSKKDKLREAQQK